jgi:DNA primase small subunit
MERLREILSISYSKIHIEVDEIEKREFGYSYNINEKITTRHQSFQNIDQLKQFLINKPPYYISYSASYYNNPSERMEKKDFIKADFIIDLDSEDLNLAKYTTKEIFLILKEELGFKKVHINFSGNRGFHIRVKDERVQNLDSQARSCLINYLSMNYSDEIFQSLGTVPKNRMHKLYLQNVKLLKPDRIVSTDLSKLLRLENSIHCGTGFIAKKIDYKDLDNFDPWKHATIPLNEIDKVIALQDFSIKTSIGEIKGEKNKVIEVETPVALYLVLKNFAKFV